MRQPPLSEPARYALGLLAEGYALTRLISESQSLSWPREPVERLESRLVPPGEDTPTAGSVVHQRVARALIERQLVTLRKEQQLHEHATMSWYAISAKGRHVVAGSCVPQLPSTRPVSNE